MQALIVVSICEKVKKICNEKKRYYFYFAGNYKGNKINRIIVVSNLNCDIRVDEEYILNLEILNIEKNRLITNLINSTPIKKICYVTK